MRSIFRKGMVAALVIGLIAGVGRFVQGAYNETRDVSGNTDFVDRTGIGTGNPQIRLGRQYFRVQITALANAATFYFSSPISGVLFSAFAVQNSGPVGIMTSTITFGVMGNLTPGNFVHPTTGGSILIPPTVGQIGQIYYNQPFGLGVSSARTPSDLTQMQGTHVDVPRGGVISIATGGEGTLPTFGSVGEYDVWIIIDPR